MTHRTITYRERFAEELKVLYDYLYSKDPGKAQQLVAELRELLERKVPVHPYKYPEFEIKAHPDASYRKAALMKKYWVVYKVTPQTIEAMLILHTSRITENELTV